MLAATSTGSWWRVSPGIAGRGLSLNRDSAVDRNGNVYFTDNRRDRILKIDLAGKINTWKQGANGAHGVAWGPDERLYAGQHDRKRVVAFSVAGGGESTETVIAEGRQSHHLMVSSRNRVYFSEPPTRKVWVVDAVAGAGGGPIRAAMDGTSALAAWCGLHRTNHAW
jgi:hypothetical protein